MKASSRIVMGALLWVGSLSGLHIWLNVDSSSVINSRLPENKRKIEFEEYVDTRFAEHVQIKTAWNYEPGGDRAQYVKQTDDSLLGAVGMKKPKQSIFSGGCQVYIRPIGEKSV
jgi:hypothetical protein